MMLTGLELQFGPYHHLENVLWFAPPLHDVDFASVLVGAMMLAGLGAVMDVSMAVASTVAEVSHAAPGTGLWGLFRSGLGAGRDIIGIMVFTLVMVFVGSNLVAFVSLAPTGWAREWMRLLNYEEAAGELARAAAAGLGMALCVPAAALTAALVGRREAGESSPQCSSRRTAYRAVWRSVLAAGVCVVAAGVADEWTLRKCYGAGSDQIAARVVAFSEPVLETMARSADPRDKTCFHSQIAVVQPCYGPRAGSLMATRMLLGPNPAHNIVLRRGAIVSVYLEEEGGRAEVSILKLPLRYRWGLVAMVIVAVVVIVAGGAVGLRALGAMVLACGLLVVVLIPMLARGAPPLAASALFCGLALLGVFAVSGAADRKALSALVGSAAGLATAGEQPGRSPLRLSRPRDCEPARGDPRTGHRHGGYGGGWGGPGLRRSARNDPGACLCCRDEYLARCRGDDGPDASIRIRGDAAGGVPAARGARCLSRRVGQFRGGLVGDSLRVDRLFRSRHHRDAPAGGECSHYAPPLPPSYGSWVAASPGGKCTASVSRRFPPSNPHAAPTTSAP